MNIMFFLIPKNDVAYVYDSDTLRQVLEKMENHRYSAIPLLEEKSGCYLGTLTEGDILWYLKKDCDLTLKNAETISIMEIERIHDNVAVHSEEEMEDLLDKAENQNFVPVVDDEEHFIGIITRKDILKYLKNK